MIDAHDLKTYAVLYVDDELQAGKYFRKGLEKDFRVLTAGNVPEAMTILETECLTTGVVITDQRMPGQTGVELLSTVRQRWPAMVRILITAYSDIESAVAAVNAGAVYKYITKPADFPLLRQTLIDALALFRQTVERDALAATLRELEEQRRATEQLQQRLLAASRQAGRAEVATGILHNVGNVLNSMNTCAAMIKKTLQQSKVGNLGKALSMLEEHTADLASFLNTDERGQLLPGYLNKLAGVLTDEQSIIGKEMATLGRSLEHIRHVVQMQQTYAKESTLLQPTSPAELMEDAVQVNLPSLTRHNVQIVREYAELPPLSLDKHKILQILINLVNNAHNAVKDLAESDKRITLKIDMVSRDGRNGLRFQVVDNGSGIAPENLTRIFTHGFTTRKEGHGFGLHCAANAAREMGGSLGAASNGLNQGASFTLELPANPANSAVDAPAESDGKVAA